VFVLNAAPAAPLRPELVAQVDVLVVNEHEAVDLASGPTSTARFAGCSGTCRPCWSLSARRALGC
jgi:sugar/nucleoside kinase (ribokinase family)